MNEKEYNAVKLQEVLFKITEIVRLPVSEFAIDKSMYGSYITHH